jgi:thiamine biosynthesis lipoprotein
MPHRSIPAFASSGFLTLALLFGCSRREETTGHHWFGMDTEFSAVLYGHGKTLLAPDSAFALLEKESARLEQVFSDYLPGSELKKLAGRAGDTVQADAEIVTVFRAAEEMAGASRGRFDITLHKLKRAYGLASGDSNQVPDDARLSEAMRGNPAFGAPPDSNPAAAPPFRILAENRLALLRDSAVFDLGGIAKGYAVDRMHAILDSLGYPNNIVTAGGDLRVSGKKRSDPWIVAIRHPRNHDGLAGRMILREPLAVSTSGDYERFFIRDGVRYHHIFDPFTGKPARPFCSVTVLAANSLLADRLTKPLFILGPGQGAYLLQRFGARAVWMREFAPPREGAAAHLCFVASPGLDGVLRMEDIPLCAADK